MVPTHQSQHGSPHSTTYHVRLSPVWGPSALLIFCLQFTLAPSHPFILTHNVSSFSSWIRSLIEGHFLIDIPYTHCHPANYSVSLSTPINVFPEVITTWNCLLLACQLLFLSPLDSKILMPFLFNKYLQSEWRIFILIFMASLNKSYTGSCKS